jgi:hypothetical protein
MPPDFLNSREDAILLWTTLTLGFVVYKGRWGIVAAFLNVVRAAVRAKLVLLFGSALVYSTLLVYVAHGAGLWHATALKATVYWFAGTAVVLIADAATHTAPRDRAFVRQVLKRIIGVTILTEFVVNLYVFPLAVEVIAVAVVLAFSMMQAVVEADTSYDPRFRRFIEGGVATVGLIYLGYFAVRGVGDLLDGAVSRDRVEEFLVGPALTIALIPFLYAVAWLSYHEQANLRRRFRRQRGRLDASLPG